MVGFGLLVLGMIGMTLVVHGLDPGSDSDLAPDPAGIGLVLPGGTVHCCYEFGLDPALVPLPGPAPGLLPASLRYTLMTSTVSGFN